MTTRHRIIGLILHVAVLNTKPHTDAVFQVMRAVAPRVLLSLSLRTRACKAPRWLVSTTTKPVDLLTCIESSSAAAFALL